MCLVSRIVYLAVLLKLRIIFAATSQKGRRQTIRSEVNCFGSLQLNDAGYTANEPDSLRGKTHQLALRWHQAE